MSARRPWICPTPSGASKAPSPWPRRLVGVKLFDADPADLARHRANADAMLALLPKRTHAPKQKADDDF